MQQHPRQRSAEQQHLPRRHFFANCGLSLGSIALGQLMTRDGLLAAETGPSGVTNATNPLAPRAPHFAAKAKRVIHLFMAGAPSQLELFDYKPKLQELDGESIPPSVIENKRFAFLKADPKLLGTRRKFDRHGESGAEISECMPHLAKACDKVTFVKSMATDVFNHGPAKLFFNTGSPHYGRPSIGAWVTYGIGSESQDLPGFVVLQSGPRGPRGGTHNYGSGFLSSQYQGVPLRSGGEPILNLSTPQGIDAATQRRTIDAIGDLNHARYQEVGDDEITARISSYEMAYRMQSSAPELIDLSGETAETMEAYGAKPGERSFANNCLLARRLVERGVRFVTLYHTDWDHHGNKGTDLGDGLDKVCRETDQPAVALLNDLEARGLLEDTLVVWGGEFGRTPMGEGRETIGRDHHIEAYTMWLAGGGIKPGQTIGETDELGFSPVSDRIHVHDLQATILHLLGLDHLKLTYRFQGREFRLTDIGGEVIHQLLS